MIIDAKNKIIGRIATFAAKQALLGNKVDIINCEQAVYTGDPVGVVAKIKRNRDRGEPTHGPFVSRMPDRLVRRVIRGMLPWKLPRGREAFRLVMCHIGAPKEFTEKPVEIQGADISKVPNLKYITVKNISKALGAKL